MGAVVAAGAVLAGCGGGGGSGGSAGCTAICADLVDCASSLGTDVATLSGDASMTSANCASECDSLSCTNKSSFVSCAQALTCTSIAAVQGALSTCGSDAGCDGGGGGGGSGCTTVCSNLVACASSLSSTVATLSGDPSMTPDNCVTECQALTCTDKAAFVGCAEAVTCSSISGVQDQLGACSSSGGCGT